MWQIINTYIIGFITIVGVFLFSRIVLDKKAEVSKTKLIIIILLASLANTVIYLNLTGTIKTLLMAIIDILFNI